ncbi:uncharacterized protein LOC116728063 isoform X1 [Xiphophorus hellerii]|uniref:uncharacterized protein LOC116728063 isoform X1 n=2 Tax=Xiphophorus hellerii TaxID=8084 RepID=UPI0013B35E81|nr:uncharacterized protein LOC116728063 isoform X1 [Xiphophorus hellerii]
MEGGTEPAEEEKEKDPNHIPVEHQEFPIMHWEELSQRIAELEKQEQERREKRRTGLRTENVWEEEEEDVRRGRVAVSTSRLNHRNLQLCFINNSDSEDDDEEEGAERKVPMGAGHNGCHGSGLKQEVAAALRALRDDLLAEQRQQEVGVCVCVSEPGQLQWCRPAETSGAQRAAGSERDAADRPAGGAAAGGPRTERRAGGPTAGPGPAEDQAGRHAAGRPGPDLTPEPDPGRAAVGSGCCSPSRGKPTDQGPKEPPGRAGWNQNLVMTDLRLCSAGSGEPLIDPDRNSISLIRNESISLFNSVFISDQIQVKV